MAGDEFTIKAVRGDWAKMAKELEKQGRRDLRKTLRKVLTDATKPARREMRDATRAALPKKGGLSKWAGKMPALTIHESGPSVGATIKLGRKGHDFKALNRGRVRHPLFGNRDHWYMEGIESGWWDEARKRVEPQVRQSVDEAMHKYIDDVARKAS